MLFSYITTSIAIRPKTPTVRLVWWGIRAHPARGSMLGTQANVPPFREYRGHRFSTLFVHRTQTTIRQFKTKIQFNIKSTQSVLFLFYCYFLYIVFYVDVFRSYQSQSIGRPDDYPSAFYLLFYMLCGWPRTTDIVCNPYSQHSTYIFNQYSKV